MVVATRSIPALGASLSHVSERADQPEDDQRLRKRDRLRKRGEYLAVQNRGKKLHLEHLLAFVHPSPDKEGIGSRRLGITVSGKVGNAVTRNRIKRLLREIWRRQRLMFPAGFDIVFIGKKSAAQTTFAALERQLGELARRLARLTGGK